MQDAGDVHGEADGEVEQRAGEEGLAFDGAVTEQDAGDDGPQGFGHGFAEVNQAVGDRHDEDGVVAETLEEGEDDEAAEEGFEGKELGAVGKLVDEKVKEGFAGAVVEGVFVLEAG